MNRKKLSLTLLMIMLSGLIGAAAEDSESREPESVLLAPDQVTPARIKAMFERKRFAVKDEKDGLSVTDNLNRVVTIQFYRDKELICMVMWFQFKKGALNYQKLKLVNDINSEVVFTRAQVDKDGDLRFDYWLRYDQGLSEEQFLSAFNYFLDSSIAALRLKDSKDLIK